MSNKRISFMAMPALIGLLIVGVFGVTNADMETNVEINIKPGSSENSINPDSNGVIPVAILGSDVWFVSDVNPVTLRFLGEGNNPPASNPNVIGFSYEDVNNDENMDLVVLFLTQTTEIDCNTTMGELYGDTFSGSFIFGEDSVNPVGRDCRQNNDW